jgi:hypothetical protein
LGCGPINAADRAATHQILADLAQHHEGMVVRPDMGADAAADIVDLVGIEGRQAAPFRRGIAHLTHGLLHQPVEQMQAGLAVDLLLARLGHGNLMGCRPDHVAGFRQLAGIGPVVQQFGRGDLELVQELPEQPADDPAAFQAVDIVQGFARIGPVDPAAHRQRLFAHHRPGFVEDIGLGGEAGHHGAVAHHLDLLEPAGRQHEARLSQSDFLVFDDAVELPSSFDADEHFVIKPPVFDHGPSVGCLTGTYPAPPVPKFCP